MMLSNADVERLEEEGYNRQSFMRHDRRGYARLRNSRGLCVFYDSEKCRCKVYRNRPSGCRTYPVIYSEEEGMIVEELCPMKDTVSKKELENKGKRVIGLLRMIDEEAARRNRT
jgi:Fe-S-cluster containining protein